MNDETLEDHYLALWRSAKESLNQNTVNIDTYLNDKQKDRRKGITLIIRPSLEVAHQLSLFLAELAVIEPQQYFYRHSELHVTILSLFSATENYEPHFTNKSAYLRIVDDVISTANPFPISFRGITASPSAVMIQGFPQGDHLNILRNQLRLRLIKEGLSAGLDRRYRIRTAHMTVLRFRQRLDRLEQFLECLYKYRAYDFGTMNVCRVQMVENDWYMSEGKVSVIKEWELS